MQLPAERHNRILHVLREQGFVTVSGQSTDLDVSEVTIRRDLKTLEDLRLLQRTHGGATQRNHIVRDRPVSEKASQHAEEKRRIGAAAAELVEPHDRLILASGTTVMQLAHALADRSDLTVITNATNVAFELTRSPGIEVHMLGGMLRKMSTSVVGPIAEAMMQQFTCRKLFLGVDGFDIEHGLTTSNALEAHLNACMIAAAEQVIVLADASKFGLRSFGRICTTDQVDRVITDAAVSEAIVQQLEDNGITVQVV